MTKEWCSLLAVTRTGAMMYFCAVLHYLAIRKESYYKHNPYFQNDQLKIHPIRDIIVWHDLRTRAFPRTSKVQCARKCWSRQQASIQYHFHLPISLCSNPLWWLNHLDYTDHGRSKFGLGENPSLINGRLAKHTLRNSSIVSNSEEVEAAYFTRENDDERLPPRPLWHDDVHETKPVLFRLDGHDFDFVTFGEESAPLSSPDPIFLVDRFALSEKTGEVQVDSSFEVICS